jgi:O-antigen ligase
MSQRLLTAAEILFLACLLAAPWPYGCASEVASFTLGACLLLAAGLAFGAWSLEGKGLPALARPATALLVLGPVQLALGVSAAPVWTGEAMLILAAMLGAALFWCERGRTPEAAWRLAGGVLLTCAAQALFGAVQWHWAPDHIYGRASEFLTTPFGSYVNHNHFAGLLGMGVVLALGMALALARQAGGPTPASLGLFGLGLGLLAAHLASRSRGGLLSLAGGLIGLVLLVSLAPSRRPKRARRRLTLGLLAAAAVFAFGLLAIPEGARGHLATLLSGGQDASGAYRRDVARDTLRLALAHPLLGSGLGAYADAFPPLKRAHGEVRTTHAESDLLEFLAEGGLIGLVLVSWLGAGVGAGLRDRVVHGRDPAKKGLALAAAAACLTLAIHSLLDFNLRLPANALVFVSLLGLTAAPRSEPRRWGGSRTAAAGTALCLSFAALAAYRACGAFQLEASLAQVDPRARIAALTRTLGWHPYLADAYRERALAWRGLAIPRSSGSASRLERAGRDMERALVLRPSWGEVWADLGWVRALEGDISGARQAFDRAIETDPSHIHVARARAEFLRRFGFAPASADDRR